MVSNLSLVEPVTGGTGLRAFLTGEEVAWREFDARGFIARFSGTESVAFEANRH